MRMVGYRDCGDTPESVNQALYETVTSTPWSWGQEKTFRVIFLVGDAPPTWITPMTGVIMLPALLVFLPSLFRNILVMVDAGCFMESFKRFWLPYVLAVPGRFRVILCPTAAAFALVS